MILQTVGGIVGSANNLYIHILNNVLRAKIFRTYFFIACIKNRPRCFSVQQIIHAKIASELEMRPLVQRISDGVRHRFSPRLEFFPVISVTGNIFFRNPVRAQCTPLVMVAAEPHLSYGFELFVTGDLVGRKMAMVIEYGHRLRI